VTCLNLELLLICVAEEFIREEGLNGGGKACACASQMRKAQKGSGTGNVA